jgi:hypothetical protein
MLRPRKASYQALPMKRVLKADVLVGAVQFDALESFVAGVCELLSRRIEVMMKYREIANIADARDIAASRGGLASRAESSPVSP